MTVYESLVQVAGSYRDLLSLYQKRVNDEILKDKHFIIPEDEYEVYLLLHQCSTGLILMLDRLSFLERRLARFARFTVEPSNEETEVQDETE